MAVEYPNASRQRGVLKDLLNLRSFIFQAQFKRLEIPQERARDVEIVHRTSHRLYLKSPVDSVHWLADRRLLDGQ